MNIGVASEASGNRTGCEAFKLAQTTPSCLYLRRGIGFEDWVGVGREILRVDERFRVVAGRLARLRAARLPPAVHGRARGHAVRLPNAAQPSMGRPACQMSRRRDTLVPAYQRSQRFPPTTRTSGCSGPRRSDGPATSCDGASRQSADSLTPRRSPSRSCCSSESPRPRGALAARGGRRRPDLLEWMMSPPIRWSRPPRPRASQGAPKLCQASEAWR